MAVRQNLELVGATFRNLIAPIVDGLSSDTERTSQRGGAAVMLNRCLGSESSHGRECMACLTLRSSMPYPAAATLLALMRRKLTTWNDRLDWAMDNRGVKNAELARACDIERASVTEWRNGKTKDPKLAPFFAACAKLNVRPRWLALGEHPIDPLPDDAPRPMMLPELLAQIAEQLGRRSADDQRRVLEIVLRMPEDVPRPSPARTSAL